MKLSTIIRVIHNLQVINNKQKRRIMSRERLPKSRILENRLKIVTFSHSFPYKYDCMTMIKSISLTNTTAFTFKLLVAGLQPVTRPLLMQKWATFHP